MFAGARLLRPVHRLPRVLESRLLSRVCDEGDWTKWLCMTQDLVNGEEDVKVGGRFANGGVSEIGTRLR